MTARHEASEANAPELTLPIARVLEFENEWRRHVGAKEEAIRAVFGLSAARYYQMLNVVIDSPEAVRQDPMLVGYLQRARDARTNARATRTFTSTPRSHESIE